MALGADISSNEFHRGLAARLVECVYAMILVVTVTGWTVAGFAVWVPLLVRSTTIMAAAVFYASLFGDRARVVNAERNLYFAVRFYLRGFEHFVRFYRERHAPEPSLRRLSEMKWRELLIDCIWVVGVWAAVSFAIHAVLAFF